MDGGKLFDLNLFGDRLYTTGPLILEGLYNIRRFKFGVSIVYERNRFEGGYLDFFGGGSGVRDIHKIRATNNVTVLFGGYYSFIQKTKSSFYTGLAVGPAFVNRKYFVENTTKNNTQPGYQFTALGYEYHNKIGLFVEVGYGYKGILCGGIQYAIPQP